MRELSLRKCLSCLLAALVLFGADPLGLSAQGGAALVLVGSVDSEAFPQVNLSVRVCDGIGPEQGLEAGNFHVEEDGNQVSPANIKAAPIGAPATRLVLAIDTSMNASDLTAVKKSAVSFVQNFVGAEDDLAVVAFYDDIELIQDFTSNRESLAAAIEDLTPEGNLTAFSDAALEGVKMLTGPADVRGVILVTNSPDNTSRHTIDDVVDVALEAGVTIYPIGFGKVKPEVLRQLATSTGGQSFIADPGEVETALHTAGQLMEQGVYRLSFLSTEMADGEPHRLALSVSYDDASGEGVRSFIATQKPVTVNLPSLEDGETVFGRVEVPVQAAAPAAIASVNYRLDGDVLAQVTAPPFILEWDTTTLTPGIYEFSVEVMDRVGNQGETSVSVQVVEPLSVVAMLPDTAVRQGQTISISTKVSGSGVISQVSLLIDGQNMDAKQTPPYDFVLDTSSYVSGTYTVSVLAQNNLGQTGKDSRTLVLYSPPPLTPSSWLQTILAWLGLAEERLMFVVGIIGLALVLVLLNLTGLWLIARFRIRRRQVPFILEVANQGNVSSQYQLRAEDPMGALRFGFSLSGVPFPEQVQQTIVRRTVTVPDPQPVAVAVPVHKAPSDGARSISSPQAGAGAKETAGKAMAAGGAAAGILGTLGRLLPGAAGQTAQQAARPIHRTQATVGTASTKTKSKLGQVGSVAPKGVTIPKSPGSSGDSTNTTMQVSQDDGYVRRPAAPSAGDRSYVEETLAPVANGKKFVLTPVLDPGDVISVDMTVRPTNPYRTQKYRFKVASEAVDAPEPSPVVEEGDIVIRGMGWLPRSLPYVISVVFIGGVVIGAAALIAFGA